MKKLTDFAVLSMLFFAAGCRDQIQHGLDERDANELMSALVSRGFDARKVSEKGKKPTWAIELDDEHASDAMRVLSELKLPRPARSTTRDVTSQSALIETPSAERLRQMEAQEGDLEQSLETMDGVTSASIELVVPPPARPGMPVSPSKASVLLRVTPEAQERMERQRGEVRALVAAGVDGLNADDVVLVIDTVSQQLPLPIQDANEPNFKPLLAALGIALTAMSMLCVFLALKLRRPATTKALTAPSVPQTATPTSPQKPIVNPALHRKASAA